MNLGVFTISQKLGSMFTILNLGLNKIGASIVNILSKVKIFSKLLTTPKVVLENMSRSIKNIAVWIRRLIEVQVILVKCLDLYLNL